MRRCWSAGRVRIPEFNPRVVRAQVTTRRRLWFHFSSAAHERAQVSPRLDVPTQGRGRRANQPFTQQNVVNQHLGAQEKCG